MFVSLALFAMVGEFDAAINNTMVEEFDIVINNMTSNAYKRHFADEILTFSF